MPKELQARLDTVANDSGVDFFGVANLMPAREAIQNLWSDVPATFPRAVSFGIALPHAIVDQQPNRFTSLVAMNYNHHAFEVINQRLDAFASQLSGIIQRAGSLALPIPATQKGIFSDNPSGLYGMFSQKMAARLAGLAWIGKSCLAVTPEAGPRVRWGCVLTDAPLAAAENILENRCGDCRECVDICPVKAFSGEPFREEDSREVRYDAHKCDRYFTKMQETSALGTCGMCLYVCPFGRKESGLPSSRGQTQS